LEIPFHKPYITDDEINAAADAIRNGWLTMGKKTFEFENNFSSYIGTSNSVAVNSCTAALHLALVCSGLSEGDEVIIPSVTFVATAEVIRYFKAKPVIVDIEKDTHLINVAEIEKNITSKTRCIIPVHFAGQPADMDPILSIAKKHRLYVIDDAAHSIPAEYKNRKIGTMGDASCFSFYATKTLSTGEGGMVCTANDEWAERIRRLRLHGISRDAWNRYSKEGSWEYDVVETGYKYNTTDINAAMGIEQLKKIEQMYKMRVNIAEKYNSAFQNIPGLVPYVTRDDRTHSWHLYPIRLEIESLKIDRNIFVEELKKRGISTSVHFIPLYRFTCYKNMQYSDISFPNSEWVYKRTVSLPIFPGMSDDQVQYVIQNVLSVIESNLK